MNCNNCKNKQTEKCVKCNNKDKYIETRRWDDIAIDEGRIRS